MRQLLQIQRENRKDQCFFKALASWNSSDLTAVSSPPEGFQIWSIAEERGQEHYMLRREPMDTSAQEI